LARGLLRGETAFACECRKENRLETKASVVLYTRPNCHLCEEMKAELSKAGCADLYRLEETNIESDPGLLQRYQYDIPVLHINGVEAFRHRLHAEEFRARITAIVSSG
jgi:glutaredoxin